MIDRVQFDRVQFDRVQFDRVQFDRVQFDRVQFDRLLFVNDQFEREQTEREQFEQNQPPFVGREQTVVFATRTPHMGGGTEFDPEAPEHKEVGREMVDESTGLGSVAAHLYRGEMERTVEWRGRLDTTTNWAVTVMSAIVAYSFAGEVSHAVILAGLLMGTVFLFIEARRFRDYDVWRSRVRSLQENLFANALDPSEGIESDRWREELSRDYRDPAPKISYREALAHRLRRVYLPLISAMLLGWVFHLWAFTPDEPFLESAALPGVSGTLVVIVVAAYYVVMVLAALPFSSKGRGESGAADHGSLDRE